MFPGAFSPVHILVVGVVALLVLGPDKLPHAARTAARAWRDFQAMRETLDGHVRDLVDDVVPAELRPARQPSDPPGYAPSPPADTGASTAPGDHAETERFPSQPPS